MTFIERLRELEDEIRARNGHPDSVHQAICWGIRLQEIREDLEAETARAAVILGQMIAPKR